MTQEQADEIMRLARLWCTRSVRRYAVSAGLGPHETAEGTERGQIRAREDLHQYLDAMVPKPAVPKCSCCGTTENLHADLGSGGPYRCSSPDCMVF